MHRLFIALMAPVLACTAALAQQMPDPSQMAGVPLPAPELPTGTVTVRLMREQIGNNIAGHPVTLEVGGAKRSATTDAQGRAQFANLPPGAPARASATVDGEALASREFPVPANGGIRVALIAGIAVAKERARAAAEAAAQEPARPGIVTIGGESRIILEFQDDALQAFYILEIVNGARTPIDTGAPLIINLPSAATRGTLMQGSSRLARVDGDRVTITGPFPPGTTAVQIGYTLPYSGDSVTIEQRWPAAFEQVFVAVEKVGDLRLSSPQLPEQQEADASGTRFVMGRGARINANEALVLSLSGLPHRSVLVRNVGMGVAAVVLLIGFWAAFSGAAPRRTHDAHLAARREKLFNELVELERQHKAGRLDDKRYAARRQTLVAQLERVLGELDRPPSRGRAGEPGPPSSGGEGVAA
jgi:hypothetical protein